MEEAKWQDEATGDITDSAKSEDYLKARAVSDKMLESSCSRGIPGQSVTIDAGENDADGKGQSKKGFTVWYLGSAIMHRLYAQSMQPWVMAEVKRKREGIKEVSIRIDEDAILRVYARDPSGQETGETIHEHPLRGLSRFARLQQDPRCFAYLTRTQFGADYICHVYLATAETTILDLFTCIREATRDLHLASTASSMGEGTDLDQSLKATFEIKYLGRARVTCKKLSSDAIDTLADRLISAEETHNAKREERRQRHASGASIKSLPAALEDVVSITENQLGDQLDRLRRGANAAASHIGHTFHYDSGDSSADDLISLGESSNENLLDEDLHHLQQHNVHTQGLHLPAQLGHHHHSFPSVTIEKHGAVTQSSMDSLGDAASSEDVFQGGQSAARSSKVMLLQISDQDISLISLDNKQLMLHRKFKDIASVSQGNYKQEVFGFIVREPETSVLMAYVISCHSESVVAEIMNTLQTAFMSAYQKSSQQQVCNSCPLHQLHRLCQEVVKLSPKEAHELLVKRIQHLPDRDVCEISYRVKMDGPATFEESVEVMMIALRQLCEHRQREHTHVSEGAKPGKDDMNLMDDKSKFVLFEGLKNKAKKSLATSFENLIRTKKKEDAKEAFRQRSWTTDAEGVSWISRSLGSSTSSTPDASPVTSPTSKSFSHDFPSPPRSPEARRRSATVGSVSDSRDREREAAKQRMRDFNHNTKNNVQSPMKTMYLLASNPSLPDSSSSSPMTSPQEEPGQSTSTPHGSWRKAIFERVCTPSSHNASHEGGYEEENAGTRRTSAEWRALWKKAMLETLLLIRMEKENSDIKARQEEQKLERKLDYEELTPCLRDVTREWEDLLKSAQTLSAETEPVSYSKLLDCVKRGVPRNLRGAVWKFLAAQQSCHSNTESCIPGADNISYEDLLKQLTTHQHAILIDLGRTFPGHPYFAKALGPGQLELFNLLKAYSLLDREVGYCQGISFIAGILLMHMEEMSAFELTKHLMVGLGLRKQYCPNMMALQVRLYQLMRLIHDHYRDLYNHFEAYEIAPALYATPWFLTLFASQYPLGFVARVFDMIFIQGPDVIFKVALMLLGSHRELILQCDTFEGVVEFLKTTLPEMAHVQMERIINQAFELDITKQLQAYEVEYHVFSEEMIYSPMQAPIPHGAHASHHHHHQYGPHTVHHVQQLQQTIRRLRHQNMDLLEKLQHQNSQVHSLQMAANEHRVNEDKLKSRIQVLELERSALLTTVASFKALIPEDQRDQISRRLQFQTLPGSNFGSPQRRVTVHDMPLHGQSAVRSSDVKDASPESDSLVGSAMHLKDSALGSAGEGSATSDDNTTDTLCGNSSSSERD